MAFQNPNGKENSLKANYRLVNLKYIPRKNLEAYYNNGLRTAKEKTMITKIQ